MSWQPANLSCPLPCPFGHLYLSLVVQLFGDSLDRRVQERLGFRTGNDDSDETFDFIIVGAGASGSVLAKSLSDEEQWKVLLLEAGGEQPDVSRVPSLTHTMYGSEVDWNYLTVPDGRTCLALPGGACVMPRGRMMGGSTCLNEMVYFRGHPADFDGWAAAGNDGWSYDDVLPLFKHAEYNLNVEGNNRLFHGVNGPQKISRYSYIDDASFTIVSGLMDLGLPLVDLNTNHTYGTMFAQSFQVNGERYSVNDAYIQPIRYIRKNLTVRIKSEVIKVLIDKSNKSYGVVYKRGGKIYKAYARKEVIVSGGAIGSPKLLLQSGIGPREDLEEINIDVIKDLPVGRNLQDHYGFQGLVVELPPSKSTLIPKRDILELLIDYYKNGPAKFGPISTNGPNPSIAFFNVYPDDVPDSEVQFCGIYNVRDFLENPLLGCSGAELLPRPFYTGLQPIVSNLNSYNRGVIKLNHTNPEGAPLIYPNYYSDPRDTEATLRMIRYLLNLENTYAFKSQGYKYVKESLPACKDYHWGTDEYFVCLTRAYTASYNHQGGTCKMGPEWDKTAVVDPKLKVYGVEGLRVVDASIMPIIVRGNMQAACMMIADNAAQFIKKQWLHSELEYDSLPNS